MSTEILRHDVTALGLYLGYLVAAALPVVLFRLHVKDAPSELVRKMLHLVATLSIFPLLHLFSTWYAAIVAAFTLVLLAYPALMLVERTALYKRVAPERQSGEFKRSLIILQSSIATLIFVFWGLLGKEWQYVAVAAVMAWGFGDAAAALVGKTFGRHRIRHKRIESSKTMEGTQAMYVTAGLAVFLTMLFYGGQPWQVSLAVAFAVAPVCAAVELFSHRGMDTITVPISAGLLMLSLMSLVSSLGV